MFLERWLAGLKEGNTLHAVLLCGPAGAGKKAYAMQAAALYLLGTGDTEGLKDCPFFKMYEPYADETGDRKYVDAVRDCCAFLNEGAFSAGRHVLVFPDAHMMNASCQNALLKTLEEPPEGSLLILTGSEEGVLPTIRSRCMIIRVGAKSLSAVADGLIGEGVGKEAASLAASLSDGVPGRARFMAGEAYTAFRKEALTAVSDALFAAPPFDAVQSLCTEKKKGDPEKAADFLDIAASLFRDALAEQWGETRFFQEDQAALRHKTASFFTKTQLRSMMEHTLLAEKQLALAAGVKPVLDAWLATLKEK